MEYDMSPFLTYATRQDAPRWLPRDIVAPANEAERRAVRIAQRAFRLAPTGVMDEPLKAALRGVQRMCGIPVTGHLDGPTAARVQALRPVSEQEEVGGDDH